MAKKIENRKHEGVFRENPATGHNHTYYSLSDAPQSPEEYVKRCSEMGFTSVALNDHGTLLGVHPFMDACKKYNINGVPGVEAYSKVCPEVLQRLEGYGDFLGGRTHLILNPKNYHGYQKISYALRDANLKIEKLIKLTYPIMGCDVLEKYFLGSDDVFATSACAQGAVGYILQTNFRIKKKLSKEITVCEEIKKEYEVYEKERLKLEDIKNELKEIKKERTTKAKCLKTPFLNKIKKAEKQVNEYQPTLFDENDEKLQEMKDTLNSLLKQKQEAEEFMDGIDGRIQSLEDERDSLKNTVALYKKQATKYIKAKEKLDAQKYIPDDELYECAKIQLLYYKKIFQSFFVEIQYHGIDAEEYIMPILLKLADETGTPIIAANDAHVSKNTEDSFEARRIIRYNYFNRAQVTDYADEQLYVKSDWELIDALSMVIPEERAKEAVRNTGILNECHIELPQDSHYPSVTTDQSFDELLEEAREGKIASGEWNDTYENRLRHEIKVIKEMGYVDYHMVVRDFCNEARVLGTIPKEEIENMPEDFHEAHEWIKKKGYNYGVGVGPGRGSAAGSLVCYLLGITNIDPIKYNLLFERFLNPERVSMPDIDSDIKTSLRPAIIRYLKWKYGERAVCSISTETTYAARGSVQMAGRERASQLYSHLDDSEAKPLIQKYLYGTTLKVSNLIPEKPGITLAECEDDFKENFNGNAEAELIWKHAKLIEGRISGTGVHAGGVIISDNDNVNDYIALAWNEEKQVWVAQCDMIKAEDIGLLKMDLLGLSTLDDISTCIHLVKKYRNIDIDIDNIPFEKEVFEEIYAKGNTNSVFQYESSGMKSMLMEFKPECFEDLILLVACYRPGPMQYLNDIIAVKHGRKPLTYKTPELESILSTTYGAIVYQEQVMQIFQNLAGYSLGAADMVRRAMSKKKTEKLAIEREAFVNGDIERGIDGCVKRGISSEVANIMFDEMMDFAKYAFNKSHAAAYALVSYQTAWLKYHYPLEYLCGLFNNKSQDDYEPLYADCKLYGIKMLPPNINKSYYTFVVENDNIRYGLSGIKGLGAANKGFINDLVHERENGDYTSVKDFLKRNLVYGEKKITLPGKKILESLINAGTFDVFKCNRKAVLDAFLSPSEDLSEVAGTEDAGSYVKRAIDTIHIPEEPKDVVYNLEQEISYLGTILSENPLDKYGNDEDYQCTPLDNLKQGHTQVFGFVSSAELKKSSKGNNMILINLQGKSGSCTVMAMNALYDEYASRMEQLQHHVVKVKGSVNDSGSIFANSIQPFSVQKKEYFINLDKQEDISYIAGIRQGRNENEGDIKVTIQFGWKKKGGCLVKAMPPLVNSFQFTEEEMELVRKRGIKTEVWK